MLCQSIGTGSYRATLLIVGTRHQLGDKSKQAFTGSCKHVLLPQSIPAYSVHVSRAHSADRMHPELRNRMIVLRTASRPLWKDNLFHNSQGEVWEVWHLTQWGRYEVCCCRRPLSYGQFQRLNTVWQSRNELLPRSASSLLGSALLSWSGSWAGHQAHSFSIPWDPLTGEKKWTKRRW